MSTTSGAKVTQMTPTAHRILEVASELFYEQGIRAVGVDLIARESGVTKKTIYDRFGSKDGLIEAYLQTRDRNWRHAVAERFAGKYPDPAQQILELFDVLDEWMHKQSRRGCCYINAHAEFTDPDHPGHRIAEGHKRWLRHYFTELADEAGVTEPDTLGSQFMMLHEGAIVNYSMVGDENAAKVAKAAASALLATALPAEESAS